MPQETKTRPDFEGATAAAGGDHNSPAGFVADLADPATAAEVLEKAFDFRGDVVLTLRDGRTVAGYLFDRRRGATPADSFVRVMVPPGAGEATDRVTVAYADVRRIEFSARDPAAGKSFETWVKKYVEKKLRGERASIESEPLE
jgi:hypothetical protein